MQCIVRRTAAYCVATRPTSSLVVVAFDMLDCVNRRNRNGNHVNGCGIYLFVYKCARSVRVSRNVSLYVAAAIQIESMSCYSVNV